MSKHLSIFVRVMTLVVLLSPFSSMMACGGGGSSSMPAGSYLEDLETFSLIAPANFLVDVVKTKTLISNNGQDLQIWITDDATGNLVGKGALPNLFPTVDYADMDLVLSKESSWTPSDSDLITVKLAEVYKYDEDTGREFAIIYAETSITYGELTSETLTLGNYATIKFRNTADAKEELATPSTQDDGILILDQAHLLTDDIDDDELSDPELTVFIAPFGTYQPTACANLEIADNAGFWYGNLEIPFEFSNGDDFSSEDLDPSQSYWVVFAEVNGPLCPTQSSITDGDYEELGVSEELSADELNGSILMTNGFAEIFITRE